MSVHFHPLGLNKSKLHTLMQYSALDGILLTSPENVFYTTGYPTLPSSGNPILYTLRNRLPFFSYIDKDGEITLLCWGFSTEGVSFGADQVRGFNDFAGALNAVRSLLMEKLTTNARLGIESTCPYYLYTLLNETLQPSLVIVDELMAQLRLIKSEEEIALLQRSTAIIEQTVTELYEVLRLGMSRLVLTQEAKHRLMRNGATGVSHITFSFGRANPEVALDEILEYGQLVTLDLGGVYNGYCSDNRRYAYAGTAPDTLRERYRIMVEIVDQVGAALVPGTTYAEVLHRAVDLYAAYRIPLLGRFNHVGHHIGLETEERWIDDDPEAKVQPNMVINIELYSLAETGEIIGNEETYIVRSSGSIRLSMLPREIRDVRQS